jgi:phospholipid/cholesterol/gamma-HCH transport system substrate-binding protein
LAPPLVKGRALARRRIAGIVFLVVIALLVQLAVALYNKRFTPVVHVALQTDRAGNQLSKHADVKLRGIVVGEVRSATSQGDGATLDLALDPGQVKLIPKNVQAQLLPKTLFGEKQVVLVIPKDPSTQPIAAGDVITQDRSSTALETETALNDLLPLLQRLQPEKLSELLNSLSSATRGRGDELGSTLALQAAYLKKLNPTLPTVGADFRGLADLANTIDKASPDLLRTLDNLSFSSRSTVQDRAALDTFLRRTNQMADTTRQVVAQNETRLIALAKDSRPVVQLYASYSNDFACMLNRIAFSEIEGERVFGGHQPGLHITVEATRDHGGYVAGDGPQYKEKRNAGCFGLGKKPIIPFPSYANPQDGYRDSAPAEDPHQGPGGCCNSPSSWYGPVAAGPEQTAVRRSSMPTGTTMLDALLLAPLVG